MLLDDSGFSERQTVHFDRCQYFKETIAFTHRVQIEKSFLL